MNKNLFLAVAPAVALGATMVLLAPAKESMGFSKLGSALNVGSERDWRSHNIFADAASADDLAGCAARGVRVTQVVRAGPAARAQLRVGDVIVSFDGHEVDTRKLAALTRSSVPGQTVELTICRSGGTLKRPLTVEEKPS